MQAFLGMGGRFTLSDDSHGVDQVGLDYQQVLRFISKVGITTLHFLQRKGDTVDERFPKVSVQSASLSDLKTHPAWA